MIALFDIALFLVWMSLLGSQLNFLRKKFECQVIEEYQVINNQLRERQLSLIIQEFETCARKIEIDS